MLVEVANTLFIGNLNNRSGTGLVSIIEMPARSFPFVVEEMDLGTNEVDRKGFGVDARTAFDATLGIMEGRRAYESMESMNRALSVVESTARHRDDIILEGPPIYLWPRPDNPTEDIRSNPATNGWLFLNELSMRLADREPEHFVLIDEFNNRPEEENEVSAEEEFRRMVDASPILNDLPILQTEGTAQVLKETSFTGEDDSKNKCQFLDAGFQMQKLISVVESNMDAEEMLARLRSTLLIVVHPDTFQSQQSAMLGALMGKMKDSIFSMIPKSVRRDIISSAYMHVWLDEGGRVTGVTQPEWDGNKFVHKEVEYGN